MSEKKSVSASGKIGAAAKIPVMRGAFLRFPRAMRQVARVSKVGCIKYSAPEGAMDYLAIPDAQGTYVDADGRHLIAEALEGPINIEKGGALPPEGLAVLHAAQHAWNALARLEHQCRQYEQDGHDIDELLDVAPKDPHGANLTLRDPWPGFAKQAPAKEHTGEPEHAPAPSINFLKGEVP